MNTGTITCRNSYTKSSQRAGGYYKSNHMKKKQVNEYKKANSTSRLLLNWFFCTLFNEHNTHQVIIKFQMSRKLTQKQHLLHFEFPNQTP